MDSAFITHARVPTASKSRGRLLLSREEGDVYPERAGRGHKLAKHSAHQSVLLKEVVHYLEPKSGDVVVDATFGAGGHSKALKAKARISLVAIDADPAAGAGVIEGNFGQLDKILKKEGIKEINKALFDLGWNRGQLSAGRGFSFMHDEPLSMSYGKKPASGFSAAEILNSWKEAVLADIIYGYGEERYARRIARAIVERRAQSPVRSSIELAEIVKDAVPGAYRHGKTHPATKTFQALRIAVNDELSVLDAGLRSAWKHLACDGRIAVITFHSIEDRAVKRLFQSFVKDGGKLVVKKPIVPSRSEIIENPAARSAKLRVIEKLCQ